MSDEKRFVCTRFFFGRYDLSFSSVYNDDLQYVCHACTRLWQGLTILRVCNDEVL